MEELYTFFMNTYVGTWRHGRCNSEALFPPLLWNQVNRLKSDLPRTDNKHECWHRIFSHTLSHVKPGLYDCLDALKAEQADQETVVADFERGASLTKVPEKKW